MELIFYNLNKKHRIYDTKSSFAVYIEEVMEFEDIEEFEEDESSFFSPPKEVNWHPYFEKTWSVFIAKCHDFEPSEETDYFLNEPSKELKEVAEKIIYHARELTKLIDKFNELIEKEEEIVREFKSKKS